MLSHWMETYGLARSVIAILFVTTLGCFAYTWGYSEGVHNSHMNLDQMRDAKFSASHAGPDIRPVKASESRTSSSHQDSASPAISGLPTDTRAAVPDTTTSKPLPSLRTMLYFAVGRREDKSLHSKEGLAPNWKWLEGRRSQMFQILLE